MRETDHVTRREEAAEWKGRLHESAALKPLRVTVARLRHSAPEWLAERAQASIDSLRQRVWEILRDPEGVGTPAAAQVPVHLPEVGRGYVLDFLLPEFGVNVQIDRWGEDGAPEPDDAWNEDRDEDLRTLGIETLRYWDVWLKDNLDLLAGEIRKEVGIGRPAWLRR